MKQIELTNNKGVVLVDDADYIWLSRYRWNIRKFPTNQYAARTQLIDGKWRRLSMHREILNAPNGSHVDHVNHNGLDNRRCNIRLCSILQNSHNGRPHKGSSSKYKGVCWEKRSKKWRATITFYGTMKSLGYHKEEIDAAKAYDTAAVKYHGDFAYTNFERPAP